MIHHFRLAQSHLPPFYFLHLSLFRGTLIYKNCNQIFTLNRLSVVDRFWFFIKFNYFYSCRLQYTIWWTLQQHYVWKTSRAISKQYDCTFINPVAPPLSSSGHKVKKLGTKWSKLLGTRTKLTENIRPPHTVWTAGGCEHIGWRIDSATNTSTIQMSCPLQISTEHGDCCWCLMKRCTAATICAAKAFIKLITGGSKHISDTSLFWVR